MKKLVLLFIFTFGVKSAFADCSSSGMYFFPEQKNISLNPMFIIEGYYFSQKTVNSFKERSVYLESENGELIELNLQDILKGQMHLTQAIFCTSSPLKPNTTYVLKYANQTNAELAEMVRYNREKKKREKIYWTTSDKESLAELNSDLTVEFKKTETVFYGCGPASYAIFNVKYIPDDELWFKTEVVELSSNKKTTYYLRMWNEKLSVGHGMCSGAFTFNKNGKYKVRFIPMTIDGKALSPTRWKTFDSP
ncbi:hypothetical protein [uncultured Psychroserpens sp.]|uniref:hypothetical protein n=1 Tax=uncultured Psychroserpens sp. TaxID=255436 RepID=UPI00262E3356|nr:hypothetical protein [uncultured Psychroserpens sp.]